MLLISEKNQRLIKEHSKKQVGEYLKRWRIDEMESKNRSVKGQNGNQWKIFKNSENYDGENPK